MRPGAHFLLVDALVVLRGREGRHVRVLAHLRVRVLLSNALQDQLFGFSNVGYKMLVEATPLEKLVHPQEGGLVLLSLGRGAEKVLL